MLRNGRKEEVRMGNKPVLIQSTKYDLRMTNKDKESIKRGNREEEVRINRFLYTFGDNTNSELNK